MNKYIFIQGFNASGTSAMGDLLREFDEILLFPDEFHYYRLPGGIAQLKHDLFEQYSTFVERDFAVKRFIKDFKKYNYIRFKKFKYFFCGNPTLNSLSRIVNEYINDIKVNEFYGQSYMSLLDKSKFLILFYKFKRYAQVYLFKNTRLNINADTINIYTYDESEFNAKTTKFINNIIELISGNMIKNHDCVVMSHFFSNLNDFIKINGILSPSRMIVIYRDPRDVFTTFLDRGNTWSGVSSNNSVEENINNFKIYYKSNNITNLNSLSGDILIVSFEQLARNYANEIKRITEFLGLSNKFSGSFFDPEKAINNIGIYKVIQSDYKNLFDYLIKEYPNHCDKQISQI